MKLQVLISTMHQTDHRLLEKMNIQSDAIVINQCDRNEFEELNYKGNSINFLSLAERGVGLSRNTALMRASADICLFADDDVTYVDDYKDIIINAFKGNPDVGMIVFNFTSTNLERKEFQISKMHRLRIYNCLKYGTFRFAINRKIISEKNVCFSLLFGGGAKYSAGEDSLFISECINKGVKVLAYPYVIGKVSHEESTWFKGYTDKYFIDKGVFYATLSIRWAKLLSLRFAIKHRKMFKNDKTCTEAFKLMIKGIREVKGWK